MPHWRALTDRDTLGAWDLGAPDKPRDWTLEIERVEADTVFSKEKPKGERKPHVYFRKTRKPLVAGATICEAIADIAGSESTEKWIGVKITIYPTRVRGKAGGQCWGIRVRPKAPTGPAQAMGDGQPVDPDVRREQNEAHGREPGSDDV